MGLPSDLLLKNILVKNKNYLGLKKNFIHESNFSYILGFRKKNTIFNVALQIKQFKIFINYLFLIKKKNLFLILIDFDKLLLNIKELNQTNIIILQDWIFGQLTNNKKFNNLIRVPTKIGLVINLSNNTPLAVLNEFRLFNIPVFCLSSGQFSRHLFEYSLLYNIESSELTLFLINYILGLLKTKKKTKKFFLFFKKKSYNGVRKKLYSKYYRLINLRCTLKKKHQRKINTFKVRKLKLRLWRRQRLLKFFQRLYRKKIKKFKRLKKKRQAYRIKKYGYVKNYKLKLSKWRFRFYYYWLHKIKHPKLEFYKYNLEMQKKRKKKKLLNFFFKRIYSNLNKLRNRYYLFFKKKWFNPYYEKKKKQWKIYGRINLNYYFLSNAPTQHFKWLQYKAIQKQQKYRQIQKYQKQQKRNF